ncbi:unnamed protein product [Arabis nemorensis]|uniref:Uncharacterized protein n=1 Tax=Arabis nemorensis TaxID=586526 RepID=A0A565BGS3_9BRAS|nr:unnamed protein product [Arabis nemorensis]
MDLEKGSQGTIATCDNPKLTSNREEEPINETDSSQVYFPLVKVMTTSESDRPGSLSEVPFLWPYSVNNNYRCIYRVPCRLKRVNPEAYTPQMLLIGPFHHSKKTELSKTDSRYLDYMKMEKHKKKYLENIELRYGNQTVEEFRRIIKRDEEFIRACYAESTEWINSHDFVEMMLHDSVFILVFFKLYGPQYLEKTGDFLFDEPCHQNTIFEDLILLDNQLPYTLLENLFEPFYTKHEANVTFRNMILKGFNIQEKIKRETKFLHFTDLCRCVRVETLGLTKEEEINAKLEKKKPIRSLRNADELDSAGVEFVVSKEKSSLVIKFEDGILTLPCFMVADSTERVFRNMMALEQCHYSNTAYVCNYIDFLDGLIETEKDVELLVNQGVIENWLGHQEPVTEMLNKMCLGIADYGSHYYDITESIAKHYDSSLNRSIATLRRVYFKDLWTGTATVAAIIILVFTLIGSVASVLQVTKNDNKWLPPPAPPRRR